MLYELTLVTAYFEQLCINRWNYKMTGTPAAVAGSFALAFASGFLSNVVGGNFTFGSLAQNIRVNLSNGVRFLEITSRAIYSTTDFYGSPINPARFGAVAGQGSAPFVAFGFRTNRVRTDVRRATKRFVGVSEDDVETGGAVSGGRFAGLTELASAMSQSLTYIDEGQTLTFVPVVCGKERYTTPSGSTAYRYFPTLAEQLTRTAEGVLWQPYPQVRSQTSRQYGRGI